MLDNFIRYAKTGLASAVSEKLPVAIHAAVFVTPETIGVEKGKGFAFCVVGPLVVAAFDWALGQGGVGQEQLKIISRRLVHEKISPEGGGEGRRRPRWCWRRRPRWWLIGGKM